MARLIRPEPADSPVPPPPELLSLDLWLLQYDPSAHGWDHRCDSHAALLFLDARLVWTTERGWVPSLKDDRGANWAVTVASRFCRACI